MICLDDPAVLRSKCTAFVDGFPFHSPSEELKLASAWCEQNNVEHDLHGEGGAVALLENRVAQVLAKPAAVFMPNGLMAQQVALRIHGGAAPLPRVGMHPLCQLALEKEQACCWGIDVQAELLGRPHRSLTAADLDTHPEALAAVSVELSARGMGGQSPTWDELAGIKAWAGTRGAKLHLDGVCLWESGAWYRKSYADIADGFDSVHVSTSRGLGGVAGAVLAGDMAFIEQARLWRRRMSGSLHRLGPLAASAAFRFDERLRMMPALFTRTETVVAALSQIRGLRVHPAAPQSNMFHLHVDAPADSVIHARNLIARRDGIWLFDHVCPSATPGLSVAEIYVGENLLAIADDVVTRAFRQLVSFSW